MNSENPFKKTARLRKKVPDEGDGFSEDFEQPDAPLNNFFGDDLLTLLYRNGDTSVALSRIQKQLKVVSDGNQPRHSRAAAAVRLGRFVQGRVHDSDGSFGSSSSKQWFALARSLNSVVGALELANTLLAERNLHVELDLNTDPLPRLLDKREDSKRASTGVDHNVTKAWYEGARVATRHRQRGFSGWDDEAFRCALECIVNYFTLPPSATRFASRTNDALEVRRHALQWIKPLWNALILAAAKHHYETDTFHAALVEQQLAVLSWLDELERNPQATRLNAPAAPSAPGANQAIVISGNIPTSTDKADNDYLKTYEILRHPMAFRELGSIDDLRHVQAKLQAEFPWATQAIAVVMSELFARKRHGANRLGMGPVLLVGTPGTGKTRFAQRLSDLLGTPSTVINLAGMSDVKLLKGVTRGWSSNRPSRMVEFIAQSKVPNPLFILDEIDKAGPSYSNGGDPQEALLDLLEPGNARRYQDIYLMTECDLSHCLYIATCNSLKALPDPLLSRLHPVIFPAPGPEHAEVIVKGILRDLESSWGLPGGTLSLTAFELDYLRGLSPREMRRAAIEMLASRAATGEFARH